VLADIHGNIAACEAVLEDIKKQAPDYIAAAGDLALRGSHPRETVDLLYDVCDGILMGNTDAYIANMYLGGAYREQDHWKTRLLEWTRNELGPERVAKLAALPFSLRYSPRKGQDLFVCHANPKNLEESIEPTLDEMTVRKYLTNLDATAVAFGHLHFPYRRQVGKILIADVASAGIPRDGDLRPAWGLFTWTPRGWRVQIRRVRYPMRKATQMLTDRHVPGAPMLIHKMIEARYRHHTQMAEAARQHLGIAPPLRPPPNAKGLLHEPLSRTPVMPPPPGIVPPPGQSTQVDEAVDDTVENLISHLETSSTLVPGETPEPSVPEDGAAEVIDEVDLVHAPPPSASEHDE
jgi:predicted phosphodiesterase